MLELPNVTLIGIDCVDITRLQKAMDITQEQISFADVKLLSSIETSDPRWIQIEQINSVEEYSEFCITRLTDYVDTDFVMVVQHDGFVLNPDSWQEAFLECDYIGAPWHMQKEFWFTKFDVPREMEGQKFTGNGGFCIRSKKFIDTSARIAREGKLSKYHPEDMIMCVFNKTLFEQEGVTFAPYELAEQFSIEGTDKVYDDQFGFHGFKWTDISKWTEANPQYGIENQYKAES